MADLAQEVSTPLIREWTLKPMLVKKAAISFLGATPHLTNRERSGLCYARPEGPDVLNAFAGLLSQSHWG